METFDHLRQNENDNTLVTVAILSVYAGAVLALLGYLLQKVVPDYEQGLMPVKVLAMFSILGVLSIQGLVFYFRLINKLRDSGFGKGLSITLSIVLLALVLAGIFLPFFSLVGIGLAFICWKAGQLYLNSKMIPLLPLTTKYFKRIFISYLVLAVLTFGFGLLVDTGQLPFFPKDNPSQNFIAASQMIENLLLDRDHANALRSALEKLNSELNQARMVNHVFLGLSIFFFFLISVYGAYRAYLIRSLSLVDVLRELEIYYASIESPQNNSPGGTAVSIVSVLALIRAFISSIAGLASTSVYLATAQSIDYAVATSTFLVVFLTSSFGFTLNDFFDIDKDKVNHPNRPLPSKQLTKNTALSLSIILATLSLFLSFLLPWSALVINTITISLLSAYSFINNKYGFTANIITAFLTSLTIAFGMASGAYSAPLTLLSIAVFFLSLGREAILDIRDLSADKVIGKSSLVIRWGPKRVIRFTGASFILASAGIVTSCLFMQTLAYIIAVGVLANLLIWLGLFRYYHNPNENTLNSFLIMTRMAFLTIVPGLLL